MAVNPFLRRLAREAREWVEAAKGSVGADSEPWAAGDVDDAPLVVSTMLALWQIEERNAAAFSGTIVKAPSDPVRFFVVGWHLPGHVDDDGAPIVYLAPPGRHQGVPGDALPIAIIVPPGREPDIAKTYPARSQ